MRFIGVYDYTVILTYLSLFSAFGGMTFASRGMFNGAILCLLASGICDAFDGTVARTKENRTEDEKAVGIQLDSLVDVVSFGLFPAFLCWCLGVKGLTGLVILFFYCTAGVIRLAFFNVLESKRQQTEGGCNKVYRGLPITSISIVFPLVWLLRPVLNPAAFLLVLHLMLAVVGFLFVLDIPIKKPNIGILLHK